MESNGVHWVYILAKYKISEYCGVVRGTSFSPYSSIFHPAHFHTSDVFHGNLVSTCSQFPWSIIHLSSASHQMASQPSDSLNIHQKTHFMFHYLPSPGLRH